MAMAARLWSVNALATELDMDRRTVAKRLANVTPSGERGGHSVWRMADALPALFGPGKGAPPDMEHDRARKMAAEADMAEMRRDVESGRLIELQVVADVVRGEYATVRTRLGSLPGILAPRLDTSRALEFQPIIAEAINEILTELSADDDMQGKADAVGGSD